MKKKGPKNRPIKSSRKDNISVVTKKGEAYEIPLEGSLGLLASGYAGVMAWRAKRKDYLQAKGKLPFDNSSGNKK